MFSFKSVVVPSKWCLIIIIFSFDTTCVISNPCISKDRTYFLSCAYLLKSSTSSNFSRWHVTRSSSPRIFGHIMFHIVSRLLSFVDVCLFSNIVLSIDKYEYWSCLSTRRLKGSTVVLERVERSSHLCLTFPCGILRTSKCIGIVTCYRNLIVFSSTQSNAHVPDSFNESHIDLI